MTGSVKVSKRSIGSLSDHDDDRWMMTGSNVKVSAQERPSEFRCPPLVDDVKRSSFTSSWSKLNLKTYSCRKETNLLSFVIAFNWLEILFFSVVVLKSSVRFVDYKIDLNKFLPSHRSDSYHNKSGGKKPPRKRAQAAEFYLSIFKTLSGGACFLHFARVHKCPSCFITV